VKANGDCFEVAGRLMQSRFRDDPTARLCHGIALGSGPENNGRRFWHAWVEHTWSAADLVRGMGLKVRGEQATFVMCVDQSNGNDGWLPAALYYRVGAIKPEEVWRYDWHDAAVKMVSTEHWGPWVALDGVL
jgi:hypothetical protein